MDYGLWTQLKKDEITGSRGASGATGRRIGSSIEGVQRKTFQIEVRECGYAAEKWIGTEKSQTTPGAIDHLAPPKGSDK